MSELISNPQPESAPRSTGPSGHVAYDGPDGLHHPGIVVRYDAVSDPPDDPDAVEDENPGSDVEETGSDAQPGTESANRIRGILDVLGQGLLALSWACLRTAYRYPRWALVIVLSVVILGATALTRPGKPTLTAAIPPEKPAVAPAGSGEPKAPEEGKKDPKPDQTALAKAGPAPATESKDEKKDDRKTGEVPAFTLGTATATAPKVADVGPANVAPDDKAPPTIDPPSSQKVSVPAPPPLTDRTVASLVAAAPAGQAPAPAPPTPAPAESPTAPAADSGRPDSALPLLPGSEPNLPPASPPAVTLPLSPVGQPAASGPPGPVEEVKLTGGDNPGNAPPPTPPAHDPANAPTGAGLPAIASPNPGPPPQTSSPQPGVPAPGLSPASAPAIVPSPGPAMPPPLRSAPALSGLPEPQGLAPKNEAEAPRAEQGHAEATFGPVAGNDLRPPKPETVQPELKPEIHAAPPQVKPEAIGEAKAPELSPVGPAPEPNTTQPDRAAPPPETPAGPASPVPGPEAPGLDALRSERDNIGEAHKPSFLKEEDLKPGHEAPATGSPGEPSRPGTPARPEVIIPPAGGAQSPKDRETVATPARPEERPAPAAASEPAPSRLPETTAREEASAGGLGASASEPSGPTAQPTRNVAEADWVRIPNKGRIPSAIAADADAFGGAGHRGSEPPLDRRGGADAGLGFDPGTSPNPPAEVNDRAVAGLASPSTGLGTAVRRVRSPGGSRAGVGSARVQPSLHIVERGENFWTISRLYYGAGRKYYRALWKANARKYPNIDELHINDVIEIPAVEDLDPAYIERPQRPAVAGREEGTARDLADGSDGSPSAGMKRLKSFPTTRTARTSDAGDGIPAGRSGRTAFELALPVGEADAAPARGGRLASADRPDLDEENGPSTAIRSTARPRNTAPSDRPVYKVRRYDTLRMIARETLGDPRRADEIYDLNRDIIDDPTRLTAGQLLELPEDADTRRVTAGDRSQGR